MADDPTPCLSWEKSESPAMLVMVGGIERGRGDYRWNDIWFDDEAAIQYEHVTRSLDQAVMFAIDAAANLAD